MTTITTTLVVVPLGGAGRYNVQASGVLRDCQNFPPCLQPRKKIPFRESCRVEALSRGDHEYALGGWARWKCAMQIVVKV